MKPIYFGVAGYPEIKRVGVWITADVRPGHFVRSAMCALVVVGEWRGIICLPPEDPHVMDEHAVIQKAKQCVDWHRKKKAEGGV